MSLLFQEQEYYFQVLESRLPKDIEDRPGITFTEMEAFFFLLNNISDFAYSFLLYPQVYGGSE